jgi:hypothetical protein
VVNKPLEFCVILATVVAIDFASAYYATRWIVDRKAWELSLYIAIFGGCGIIRVLID